MIGLIIRSLTPFLIELFGDWMLIKNGNKDIHWGWRVIMIAASGIKIIEHGFMQIDLHQIALSVSLFCFFDPALNVLRFGFKRWSYRGETKWWDKTLNRLNLNPLFELSLRFISFCLLLYISNR